MLVTEGGIIKDSKLRQFLNAANPMLVTEDGIVTGDKQLHPSKT